MTGYGKTRAWLELGSAGGLQSGALPTRCWAGFLEHGVLGPAALPAEQRAAGSASPMNNGPHAGPHGILLELPGHPALSEVCEDHRAFSLITGRCCRVPGFSASCLAGPITCQWQGGSGCPAKVRGHLSHEARGRGIPGGEPLVAHGVPEKKKTRPTPDLCPLTSGFQAHHTIWALSELSPACHRKALGPGPTWVLVTHRGCCLRWDLCVQAYGPQTSELDGLKRTETCPEVRSVPGRLRVRQICGMAA